MSLAKVHQILIVAAIALAAIYALRSFSLFFRGQGDILLAHGIAGIAVAVGLGLYLKRFREKLRPPSAREEEPKSE